MKKLVTALLVFCLTGATSTVTLAAAEFNLQTAAAKAAREQVKLEDIETLMFFGSDPNDPSACIEAFKSGNYRGYVSGFVKLHPLRKKSSRAGCAFEEVRESKVTKPGEPAWVIHGRNDELVSGLDGTPVMDGQCSNWIHKWIWLDEPVAKDGRDGTNGTNGTNGKDGKDGRDGKDFTPPKKGGHGLLIGSLLLLGSAAATTAIVLAARRPAAQGQQQQQQQQGIK